MERRSFARHLAALGGARAGEFPIVLGVGLR
jgi:hypothetical protein